MPRRVLVFQSDPLQAKNLSRYFLNQGDRVWKTARLSEAVALLDSEPPELALIDLDAPDGAGLALIRQCRRRAPMAQLVITNRQVDLRAEIQARELGAAIFLREPFTPIWIERALRQASPARLPPVTPVPGERAIPRVGIPMRFKITVPYVLLALTFTLMAAFLIGRYIQESLQERFTNQLADTGRLAADWMVAEEQRRLETLRLIANTEGVSEAIEAGDAERLRSLVLPLAINAGEEAVAVLDRTGTSLIGLHRNPEDPPGEYRATRNSRLLAEQPFVQRVLLGDVDILGDKFAGLAPGDSEQIFYIAGPVRDLNNQPVGVVLVGKTLPSLARQLRQSTLGHITFYTPDGAPLASTLFEPTRVQPLDPADSLGVLLNQDQSSFQRDIQSASSTYTEILGPWEARSGADLGIMGIALAPNLLAAPRQATGVQVMVFIGLIFLAVILVGLLTARMITLPLKQVVDASRRVAEGNFQIKVKPSGNDEISVLATTFNYMVAGLQEGSIYRDLLGRTVSPQVRDALRESFASGELRLEGQSTVGTVLISDIRNFTNLAEKEDAPTILKWLNEYFGRMVPVVNQFGGVIDKFEGDSMMAFFGILPTRLPSEQSSFQACQAAVALMQVVNEYNAERSLRGDPPMITGFGINTGMLMVGGLGATDRLDYTIIGDTVNTAQRIQELTRQFGETGCVVGENTLSALGEQRLDFRFDPLGEHALKGKSEVLWVYRMRPGDSAARLRPDSQRAADAASQAAAPDLGAGSPAVQPPPAPRVQDAGHAD
ncbi:MAG TPA: adenylate/guanylate cyclase domain-containing protein [Anaerolineales bacterium]|nr:adenylate/guanylate cyclase domain-containing protein [Anaerolineales bacterium]